MSPLSTAPGIESVVTARRIVSLDAKALKDTPVSPADEEIPSNVAKLKFYYVGGSSTFSSKDGYGCVSSKQTEVRSIAEDGIYDIFTLPHTEDDMLTRLTITALDQNDNTIKERTFENVPVTCNQITRYTGSFFGSGGSDQQNDGTFRLTADPDWDSVNGYTF